VADGGEHSVVLIAVTPAQEIPAQMTVVFPVADHRHDGRAAAEFAFDDAMNAAFLSRDEYALGRERAVPTEALVHISPLDAAGRRLGFRDHLSKRVPSLGSSPRTGSWIAG
jgi:hypothetical protein